MKSQTVSEDEQAYIGIKGTDVSSEYAQYYNLPEGIYVSSVTSGSPAEKAGIKKGDVVVKYKGKDVTTMEGLQEKMSRSKAGDKVEITVKRADNGEYKEVKVTVTLGRKSDAPQETTDSSSSEGNSDSDNGSTNNGSDSNSGQNSRNGGSFFN